MYERGDVVRYEYFRTKLDKNNYAMNAGSESHRDVIDKMAAEGKRYAGWFPVTQGPTGKVVEFDLVFEVAQ